jgi:hypothetical protein
MALPGGSYSRASEGPGGWLGRCQHAAAKAGPGNGSGSVTRTRGCASCPYAACWGEDGCGAVPWWPRKDGRVPSGAVQRSLSRRDGTARA